MTAIRAFLWRRPDWWCVAGALVAWALLIGHAMRGLGAWLVMIFAMMVPVRLASLRHVAFRSLAERRHRAIAGYLVGYLAPWLLLGALASAAAAFLVSPIAAIALFALAAIWTLMPARARALAVSHRTYPLAPIGFRADLGCMMHGLHNGVACALASGPLMLACAATGHTLVSMIAGAALALAERRSSEPRPLRLAASQLALATAFSIAAILRS